MVKLTPISGTREELESIVLKQLADRSFAQTKDVVEATVESIIAKLSVDRQAFIPGFGTFVVAHLPNRYVYGKPTYNLAVVFTPDAKLVKYLEGHNVKL